MSSTSPSSTSQPLTTKKPIRELSSITNHLLLTKTLNALVNNNNNTTNTNSTNSTLNLPPPPLPSTSSIKENIPNDSNLLQQQQKALNLRLAAALKPVDKDNVATLLQFYQTLSNNQNTLGNLENIPPTLLNNLSALKQQTATKKSTTMTFLCRFNQRNRLIEIPPTNEFYNQHHGISHEHLKQLISKFEEVLI